MAVAARSPRELAELRRLVGEIADLHGAMALLGWDQNTHMPPAGAETRAEQMATLERLAHDRLVDPELGRVLDALEPWVAEQDPDGDAPCLVRVTRRHHEKAARVPTDLAAEMAGESARGYADWLAARRGGGFARCRDSYMRQVDLRRRYAALFPDAEHPYDVLLDDYEPGMTTAQVRPLFRQLVDALAPIVEATATTGGEPYGGAFAGHFPLERQREAIVAILTDLGLRHDAWRIDASPHPFAQSPGHGDYRITTRYREDDFAYAFYSALHEFGHGLYDAGLPPRLARTPLHGCASLGVHESQSRLWENVIGRGRPFTAWLQPRLASLIGAPFDAIEPAELFRAVNLVTRSAIRTEADETTYNLHVALRLELELALIEGHLEVDELPDAFAEGLHRLVGVEVRSDAEGVLQDVHWAAGSFGYFPTYTIGNVMAAQLWRRARADLPGVEDGVGRGEVGELREWLRRNVHDHGAKFLPRDLLRRVTGEELRVEPLVDYLRGKLADAGILTAPA